MDEPRTLFRQMHHVCIVVHDIVRAEAHYEQVGIGPWQDYPPLDQYTELEVPDRAAFLAMRYRYCDIDNMQIQLCQPPEADCPQRRFLDEKGEGVFHLGFSVGDCNAAESDGREAGLEILMRGRRPDGSGFTYFDNADQAGTVLEIRQAAKA
jgi:methylmalonyl-CoA/ethylmalonyl-CoA epimerase